MNRKNLTAAVLAGLAGVAGIAGTAQAVNMNPDGLGQVLIYPYYTANDGNQTILSVVNTTDQAKAVKVRFLEGFNSREVLDFNLYMSEYDVWVASIAEFDGPTTGDSRAMLVIPDTSCTVPYLYDYEMGYGKQEFLTLAYTGDFADGGPTSSMRTMEGHFEMIEMGTLTGVAADNVRHQAANDDGIRLPKDCMELTDYWTDYVNDDSQDGIWFKEADANADCEPYPVDLEDLSFIGCQAESYTLRPSGGLFGGAAVVDAENGTMYSYDAQALQGFDDTVDGIHYIPGTIFPSLNSGSTETAWVFFGVPQNQAIDLTYPDDPNGVSRTIDAVSAVFMHETIMNTYTTDDVINAATEWVVTFPTKNFYADPLRMVQAGFYDTVAEAETAGAKTPFTALYQEETALGQRVCETVFLSTWDREEASPESPDTPVGIRPPVVSPSLPICEDEFDPRCQDPSAPFQICNEVNILRFGAEIAEDGMIEMEGRAIFDSPEIDGESLVKHVDAIFVDGWAKLDLGGPNRIDAQGLLGLPVTGFAAEEYENNFLDGGVKANYGGLFMHKGNVRQGAVPTPVPPVTTP
jgi:hypothetical protein